MSFVYVWWLEADYQPAPESESHNQEGHVSAVAHRTLTVTISAKQKKKKLNNVHGLVRELCGSWPGCCSLTPSPLASFSVTNRRLPAKLFPNRWICFLLQGAFLFFVLNKAKYHCCLSLQHSAVYFTPRAMGISQEDKLPDRLLYSLPAAPQITSAYVYTPYFKSQTTPQDSFAVLSSRNAIPSTQDNIYIYIHKIITVSQFWAGIS